MAARSLALGVDRGELWIALLGSDFGWEQQRTLAEFDGKIKYGRLLRAGSPSRT